MSKVESMMDSLLVSIASLPKCPDPRCARFRERWINDLAAILRNTKKREACLVNSLATLVETAEFVRDNALLDSPEMWAELDAAIKLTELP